MQIFEITFLRFRPDTKKASIHHDPYGIMAWASRFLWPLGLQLPSRTMIRHILLGFLIGLSVSWPFMSFVTYHQRRKKERRISRLTSRSDAFRGDGIVDGVSGLIGMWQIRFIDMDELMCRASYREHSTHED